MIGLRSHLNCHPCSFIELFARFITGQNPNKNKHHHKLMIINVQQKSEQHKRREIFPREHFSNSFHHTPINHYPFVCLLDAWHTDTKDPE